MVFIHLTIPNIFWYTFRHDYISVIFKCRVTWAYDGKDIKCGRVIPVRTLVKNNDCDKSDTDDSEQCLRVD